MIDAVAATTSLSLNRSLLPLRLLESLGIFFAGVALTIALLSLSETLALAMTPMLAASLLSALWMWRRLPWRYAGQRLYSFGGVLLIACILNRILYLADCIFLPDRFGEWPIESISPTLASVRGEMMAMIGTFLTVAAWWAAGGARPRMSVDHQNREPYWIIYALSLVVLVLTHAAALNVALLGQFTGVLITSGLAACWFINTGRRGSPYLRIGLSIVMVIPFFWVALGYAMKEAIIFALLPAGVQAWMTLKSRAARLLLILFVVTLAGWANSFVSFYRTLSWYSGESISQAQALVEHTRGRVYVQDEDLQGWDISSFIVRADALYPRGWTVSLVDAEGFMPDLIFGPLKYVFIPRVVWSDKPEINPGLNMTELLFGMPDINSATATGLYPAFYLGGGWIAVIAGALLAGALIAMLTALAGRIGGAVLLNLFGFAMAMLALRFDEGWPVGAFSGPVLTLAYLAILYGAMRLAGVIPMLRIARR